MDDSIPKDILLQEPDFKCYFNFLYVDAYPPTDNEQIYCNSTWDTVSCLPTTLAGTTMQMKCPSAVDGYELDSSQNATRFCFSNGVWDNKTDYSRCFKTESDQENEFVHTSAQQIIYFLGFGTSTIALVASLVIFLYFRSLRCLRNIVHIQLMVSFILRDVLWMVLAGTLQWQEIDVTGAHSWLCKTLVTLYNYFHMTNFFWMFIEGAHLFMLIVWMIDRRRIKFWAYATVGWVMPVPFTVTWVALKYTYNENNCWFANTDLKKERFDWLFTVPMLLVLLINVILLSAIVWTIVRSSTAQRSKSYRKTLKATLALVPLLGITYILFIVSPSGDPTTVVVFAYFNATLLSTQGLTVALFYCLLTREVRSCVLKKWKKWQGSRNKNTIAVSETTEVDMALSVVPDNLQ